jgi:mannosyltransferase
VTASAGNPVTVHGPDRAAPGPRRARLAGAAAWMPLIPALVTLAVTLYQIQRPSLWRDEGATLAAVHRSLPQLLTMLGHTDVVHGAYYVLMWFETRAAGTSVLALRFPSAVGMAVAAGFIAALGRRLVSTRAGLAAGLVFAALPSVTWYAQNARSYALVTALATIASYLLVRAMTADPGRRWRWLTGYGVTVAAMSLGNIFALLLIPAHGLTLALWARRDPATADGPAAAPADGPAPAPADGAPAVQGWPAVRGWLAASVAALVVASPVVLISIGQRGQVSWLKPLDAAQIASVRQLLGPPALAATVLLVTVATFAFCALRGRLATDMPARLLALSLPWLLLPPALLLAASAAHPVYSLRYIMFCAPAAALLAGAGLAALGWAGGAAGLALIVLVALPGQASDRRVGSHSENLRQLSHLVAVHSRPGDALLVPRLSDREFEAAYPAPYRPLRDLTLSQTPTQSATLLGTPAPTPVVRHRLTTVHRLWVIETGNERGNVPVLSGMGFQESHRWTVSGIWLVLYTRPG